VALAVAWYGLSVFPGSNLAVVVGTIHGDRLLYLPSVAACLAGGALLAGAFRPRPAPWARRAGLALSAAVVAGLAGRSAQYAGAWRDDIRLFEWAVAAVPGSTKAHHKLGEEYLRAGRVEESLRPLERALEIAPGNVFAAATRDQAVQALLRIHPAVVRDPLGASLPDDPVVLETLGQVLTTRGDEAGGRRLLRAADSLRARTPSSESGPRDPSANDGEGQ
jgi:tetratricopeptide (TPR) repeat protein